MKYRDEISNIIASPQNKKIITFDEFTDSNENKEALHQYKINNIKRIDFELDGLPVIPKIKRYIKRMIR
jgi:hypothetical protein